MKLSLIVQQYFFPIPYCLLQCIILSFVVEKQNRFWSDVVLSLCPWKRSNLLSKVTKTQLLFQILKDYLNLFSANYYLLFYYYYLFSRTLYFIGMGKNSVFHLSVMVIIPDDMFAKRAIARTLS